MSEKKYEIRLGRGFWFGYFTADEIREVQSCARVPYDVREAR